MLHNVTATKVRYAKNSVEDGRMQQVAITEV
jgi:hypothetical protein